jgi:hypothetical protein
LSGRCLSRSLLGIDEEAENCVGEDDYTDPFVGSEQHVREEPLPNSVVTDGAMPADFVSHEAHPHPRDAGIWLVCGFEHFLVEISG